jgi:hypothetical protein
VTPDTLPPFVTLRGLASCPARGRSRNDRSALLVALGRQESDHLGLSSTVTFPALSEIGPQRREMLTGCACRIPFDHSVAVDKGLPEWRQHRSTTILTASLSLDGGMAKNPIDLVDQILRSAFVGTAHR